MTTLLKKAVKSIQSLPAAEQDSVAEMLFAHITSEPRYRLTPAQVRKVQRTRQALRAGMTRVVSEKEMTGFWKDVGL